MGASRVLFPTLCLTVALEKKPMESMDASMGFRSVQY